MREFHFFTDTLVRCDAPYFPIASWEVTDGLIRKSGGDVYTFQMGLLNAAWDRHWEYGDRVFIHDGWGVYELKEDCERTDRELRRAHNVFKLFAAGEFSYRGV